MMNDNIAITAGTKKSEQSPRRSKKCGCCCSKRTIILETLSNGAEFPADLAHESWRDGSESEDQKLETAESVISHTKMAQALMDELGTDVFSERSDLLLETDILRTYGEGALAAYAAKAYDSSADFWKLMEDGSLAMDEDGWLKDSNGNYILDENGNRQGADSIQAGLQNILGIDAETATAMLYDQGFVFAGKENGYWNNAANSKARITLENEVYKNIYNNSLSQHNTLNIYNNLVANGIMDRTEEYDVLADAVGKTIADATYGSAYISYDEWKANNFIKNPEQIMRELDHSEPLGANAVITSPAGVRANPFTGESEFHTGYDYSASVGTPFYSLNDGKVFSVGKTEYGGNTLTIEHEMTMNFKGQNISVSYFSEYMHMDNQNNSSGISWNVGELIGTNVVAGYTGNTGNSTGPHLHSGTYLKESNPMYNWIQNTDAYITDKRRGRFFDYRYIWY
ncbi:MAG: M23 family metallopeptidase [Spirochaetales bacterium]|nr:M23 family metallopeptidase [Spirochaetales bacterium]